MDSRSGESAEPSQAVDEGRILSEEDRTEWKISQNRKESEKIIENINQWMVIFQ